MSVRLSHGGLRICPACDRPRVDIRKSAPPAEVCMECHNLRCLAKSEAIV